MDQCVHTNQSDLWTSSSKFFLFSEKLDLIISPEQEDQYVNDLNGAVKPIIMERNRNYDFRLFSVRLYNEIYEQLSRKQNQSGD
jgi:hypothetical protein